MNKKKSFNEYKYFVNIEIFSRTSSKKLIKQLIKFCVVFYYFSKNSNFRVVDGFVFHVKFILSFYGHVKEKGGKEKLKQLEDTIRSADKYKILRDCFNNFLTALLTLITRCFFKLPFRIPLEFTH